MPGWLVGRTAETGVNSCGQKSSIGGAENWVLCYVTVNSYSLSPAQGIMWVPEPGWAIPIPAASLPL